jgi:hypothetical protein
MWVNLRGRKHGRRVRRGDDGAEEHRLQPGEIEQVVGGDTGKEGADDDADGRQEHRRDGDAAQSPPGRREPALVEDRGKRDDPDRPRELGVVEVDPARPIRAEQHPERQEREQRRHPDTRGAEGHENAPGQDRPGQKERRALVHAPIVAARRCGGRRV